MIQYPKVPHPEWESFAERRQAWEKPLEGAVQYKTKVRAQPVLVRGRPTLEAGHLLIRVALQSFGEKMPGSI
ncbi:MAG: hypothetical protein CMP47_16465 [Rickettsiales bacterium]|nr:hypothetical protein [Rickettsiales bacterium]